ncbi:MAG: SemiSWEET family transporter [Ilumatobacteraceae bacterium]
MTFADALGAWCVAVSIAFVWPQVWRCFRHDTSHGISPFATLHAVLGSVLWLAYGLLDGIVSVWASNASMLVAQVLIASVIARHGRMTVRLLGWYAFTTALLLATGLATSAGVVGWTAIVVSGSGMIPVVLHVRNSPNLHGISIASWMVTVLACCSWTAYGWVSAQPTVTYVNYFTVPLMFFVIVRAWRWRNENDVPVFGRTAAAAG